jgi:hypothetical protein
MNARKYKKSFLMIVMMSFLILAGAIGVAAGDLGAELAQVRRATAPFHRVEAALAAGHHLVPGIDYCWEEPGVGGMGYHYVNTDRLDTEVNALQPETMVYVPGPNGQLQLGAVEYVVPAPAWDAEGHGELPSVLGQRFHYSAKTDKYILHAWIWRHNPAGIFEDWNPEVSCP